MRTFLLEFWRHDHPRYWTTNVLLCVSNLVRKRETRHADPHNVTLEVPDEVYRPEPKDNPAEHGRVERCSICIKRRPIVLLQISE